MAHPICCLGLLVALAAPPAMAQQIRNMTGGGIAMLHLGDAAVPMATFRYSRIQGFLAGPDLTLSGVPPFFFVADMGIGAALPLASDRIRLVVTAGPSAMFAMGGGVILGLGGSVGLLAHAGSNTAIRFDIGPRYFRENPGSSRTIHAWQFGFTIMSLGRQGCRCDEP